MSGPLENFFFSKSTLHFQRNMSQTYYLIIEDTENSNNVCNVYLKITWWANVTANIYRIKKH